MNIKVEQFEGTLTDYVDQVRKKQIDPLLINLETITTQIETQRGEQNMLSYAEALSEIAYLMTRKSAALLPLDAEIEEETEPAEVQQQRYAEYASLIEFLDRRESDKSKSFTATVTQQIRETGPVENYLETITLEDLSDAFQNVLKRFRKSEGGIQFKETIEREPFSLADKMTELQTAIRSHRGKLQFEQLFAAAQSKLEIIVTFLAMLELIKQREIRVNQERRFGPIFLEKA